MNRNKNVIVIDPGHGGKDPGAVSPNGLMEKNIARLASHQLKSHLEKVPKMKPTLTRYIDKTVPLQNRVDKANKENADIFISIHCNSFYNPSAHGVETFNYPNSTQGWRLSTNIYDNLVKSTGLKGRGVKTANFYVLKHTKMPAALVELAFLSNPSEASLLDSILWINDSAKAISKGIKNYFMEEV